MRTSQVTSRNAAFQQWQALLDNRSKRHRRREFLVQGVRPITLAIEAGWPVHTLIRNGDRDLSQWAAQIWSGTKADRVEMSAPLIAELGERDEESPELVAIAALPADDLDRIPTSPQPLVVVFDRPASPGNIGTLVRTIDAFGASGLIVSGHAADPWDPRAVRASTGSIFHVPVVRSGSPSEVLTWAEDAGLRVVGTDEAGEATVRDVDWSVPTLLVVGNETRGMAAVWRQACELKASIPMAGSGASSLNAAVAASIVLHEALWARTR